MKRCPSCGASAELAARFCLECGSAFEEAAQAADDPWRGRMVAGRFRLVAKLGDGGMGEVYRAEQLPMGRHVALKILRRALSDDPKQVERFKREAQAASQLSHPNTIIVHDFGQDTDGTLFIAMEYLEGEPLSDLVAREGALPAERAARIMQQVCSSLDEAHGVGLVHRDLKPENIFLIDRAGSADFVKVLDFGIAKVTESGGQKLDTITQAGAIFGTPQYMAPEQVRGELIDARADIYALGVVLYELISGGLPFTAGSVVEMLTKHLTAPPAPITRRSATADPALSHLEAIALRALSKDPASRQQTARAFLEDLMAALPQLSLAAPTGLMPATPVGSPDWTEPVSSIGSGATKVVVFTALLAAVAAGGWFWMQGAGGSGGGGGAGIPAVLPQDAPGDQPGGGAVASDAPASDAPASDAPASDAPASDAPASDAPAGAPDSAAAAPSDAPAAEPTAEEKAAAAAAEQAAEAEAKAAEAEAAKAEADANKPLTDEEAARIAAQAEAEAAQAGAEAKAAAAEKKVKAAEEKAAAAATKKAEAEAKKLEAEAEKKALKEAAAIAKAKSEEEKAKADAEKAEAKQEAAAAKTAAKEAQAKQAEAEAQAKEAAAKTEAEKAVAAKEKERAEKAIAAVQAEREAAKAKADAAKAKADERVAAAQKKQEDAKAEAAAAKAEAERINAEAQALRAQLAQIEEEKAAAAAAEAEAKLKREEAKARAKAAKKKKRRVGASKVFIRTRSIGVRVSIDGKSRGTTPLRGISLKPGKHRVTATKGGKRVTRTITVKPGKVLRLRLAI